MEQGLLS